MCKFTYCILLSFVCTTTAIHAQSVPAPYEVGTWHNFSTAAVTYTFDDNCQNQFTSAVPLFDAAGFKATFYPVINWKPDWNVLKSLAANGHEIGSHSISHPSSLAGMKGEEEELKNSKAEINRQIPGNQCITIAYPYCKAGTRSLLTKYYIAGRKCQGQIESNNPSDFYSISAISCGSTRPLNSVHQLNSKVEEAKKTNGWCVFLIHEIDNGTGYSPLPASVIKGNLDYLKQNSAFFWVSTFSNVVRYIQERNAVSIQEISTTISSITLNVHDTLPDSIYNVPLSIRRPLPSGWNTVSVSQNGAVAQSSIVLINGARYVVFDAIPDNGEIVITSGSTDIVKNRTEEHYGKQEFRFTKNGLLVDTHRTGESVLEIQLIDFTGRIISTYRGSPSGNNSILLPPEFNPHTLSILRVRDGSNTWVQRLIPAQHGGFLPQ